ncbi:TPA: hypothetical protein N0F65_009410 [Lagenidium giganteum]|uniref:Calcineurin-like phosphoesterase domain-containing protein n=1 Tax=Lagenidium giganteum TaxID=4803 RepID=A0AAV2Z9F1_9STRA|nr:TPA: hypothetical protein N0F65_009410 [Lagenidium giganteum]
MLTTSFLFWLAVILAAVTAVDEQTVTHLRGVDTAAVVGTVAPAAEAPVVEEQTATSQSPTSASTCQLTHGQAKRLLLNCQSDRIRFVGIGDWGEAKETSGVRAVRDGLLRDAPNADFILSVGDNFYDNGVKSVNDPQWQKTWVERFGIGSKLNVPWISILGNHDHKGSTQAQVDYAKGSQPGSKYWVMPDRMFSIDTTANGHQMRVIATDTEKLGERGDNSDAKILQLNSILQSSKVKAYFGGHEHDMQVLQSGNLDYFMFGGGGRSIQTGKTPPGTKAKTLFYALRYGYAIFDLDVAQRQLSVTYKMFNLNGSRAEERTFTRQY